MQGLYVNRINPRLKVRILIISHYSVFFPPAYSRSYVSFIFHEPLEDNSVGTAEMVLIILIMKEYFKYLHAIGDVFTMISSYLGLLVPIRMTSGGKGNVSERFFCHTAAAPPCIFVVKAVKPIQQ